jgi:hypothetical protein
MYQKSENTISEKIFSKSDLIENKFKDLKNLNSNFLHPKSTNKVNPSEWDNTWNNSFSKTGVN